MPRVYHSISSVLLGMRCSRAWAYRYVAGLREREYAWDDPAAPPRARSAALGKATHAVFEAWQRGERDVSWRDLPGQVALSGAHHVPHPERVHDVRVEAPIGTIALPLTASPDAPRFAYELHGVKWAGFRDLLVSAPGEFVRLKIDAPDGWALYDYKSTASIAQYALDAAGLAIDPQASLYTAATCDELGLGELPCRWLYVETKRVRKALPVDACIRRDDAKTRLVVYAEKARELDQIERVEDAPMNTGACGEYGGCYYHVSNGGPCNARRSVGGLIQARIKKDSPTMALDPATASKFAAFKNGAKPAAPTNAAPSTTAPDTSEGAESAAPPPAPTPKPRLGKKPTAAAPAPVTPVGGTAGSIAALSAELSEVQSVLDAANARAAELLTRIKAVCG